jgi:hypothetical protein
MQEELLLQQRGELSKKEAVFQASFFDNCGRTNPYERGASRLRAAPAYAFKQSLLHVSINTSMTFLQISW